MSKQENGIKEISFLVYLLLFMGRRTALSDYYAKGTTEGNGKIFSLFEDGEPVSFLILGYEVSGGVIRYLETEASRRGQGYATRLVNEVCGMLPISYMIHLVSSEREYEIIDHIAKKCGFREGESSTIYTVATDEKMWAHMDEIRVERMAELMLPRSGKCISFADLTETQKDAWLFSQKSEFQNSLATATFILNGNKNMDKKLSYGLMCGDTLLAYTLITRPKQDHVVVEQISTTSKRIGSGVIICPLAYTLKAIRNSPEIKRLTLTIIDTNQQSKDFTLRILEGLEIEKQKNMNYVREGHPGIL